MLDFLEIMVSPPSRKSPGYIYPDFYCGRSSDLMIKGHEFYAIWDERHKTWSTDEDRAMELIDEELREFKKEHPDYKDYSVKYCKLAGSGSKDRWRHYVTKLMSDGFVPLDSKLVFNDTPMDKENYSTKRLPYSVADISTPGYDELVSQLYSPSERRKLEWAIGSIFTGDSRKNQKFVVLYGSHGTGKSTMLNIIEMLFDGYWAPFNASKLSSRSESFPLDQLKDNPIVAIQHDGDLSRIEDNTILNSIISHETMLVNEKFKAPYPIRFQTFLFMGSNELVKITGAKSGIIRRLIDVRPTGNTLEKRRYLKCMERIKFELPGIAKHCIDVYNEDPYRYDDYEPRAMMEASNDFYNFMSENYDKFLDKDYITAKAAWDMYKEYAEYAGLPRHLTYRSFKNEFSNYFMFYLVQCTIAGQHYNSVFRGFKKEMFLNTGTYSRDSKESIDIVKESVDMPKWLQLQPVKEGDEDLNRFYREYDACPAQYASAAGTPAKKWIDITTVLRDIDVRRVHYVKMPENHICIDFDLKDENGEKSLAKNLEAASKFPKTYAEVSKGGGGLHLHYIYDGDASELSRVYEDNIEIKVFTGNSSLRRRLSLCNGEQIAHISSGLPKKGPVTSSVIDWSAVKNEKALRTMIRRSLNKEYLGATKPEMDFIKKYTDDAFESGLQYDIRDLRPAVMNFAASSTNNANYCMELVEQIHWNSEEELEDTVGAEMVANGEAEDDSDIIFYDVEVFPNLFLVCWKKRGAPNDAVAKMINPSAKDIGQLVKMKLVGFNNRKYDNHILFARMLGYTNEELYSLSQRLIDNSKNVGFRESANLSYTDIYDFAATKQSLKKWEIELKIHHLELGLPWDQPVPETMWTKVAEYCANDVIATEAVFEHLNGDFAARKILAKIAKMSPNDTTNQLTTRIIFGKNRKPNLVYTNLATGEMSDGGMSDVINAFPGYEYVNAADAKGKPKNMYRGIDLGFGGYVFATQGYWRNVALLDVRSMHPSSAINLRYFGEYTQRFEELVMARAYIKHRELEKARAVLDGALAEFLPDDVSDDTLDQLSLALKIAINSVYGLTSASFENAFKDSRNVNNIVALRGALFMKTLQDEVTARGFTVAHIKTDSIKIPDATPEIIEFCMEFAKKYGYEFEHEATYEKMCLVNDAVYVAKYMTPEDCEKLYGYVPGDNIKHFKKHGHYWTATGTQFQVPYVFKTLFSHEGIEFDDLCETKSVTSSMYLDMNEDKSEELTDMIAAKKKLESQIKRLEKKGDDTTSQKEELNYISEKLDTAHDYVFVGRCGQFCPIKTGAGGGVLVRDNHGKFDAVVGTKGYRWLESEVVRASGGVDTIDKSYYVKMVDDAVDTISQYCDFEEFAA